MSLLEDGSLQWSIDGKIKRANARIVAKMRDEYQKARDRGEPQPVKFAMRVLIANGVIEDTKRDKDMSWHEVAKAVGHEK